MPHCCNSPIPTVCLLGLTQLKRTSDREDVRLWGLGLGESPTWVVSRWILISHFLPPLLPYLKIFFSSPTSSSLFFLKFSFSRLCDRNKWERRRCWRRWWWWKEYWLSTLRMRLFRKDSQQCKLFCLPFLETSKRRAERTETGHVALFLFW